MHNRYASLIRLIILKDMGRYAFAIGGIDALIYDLAEVMCNLSKQPDAKELIAIMERYAPPKPDGEH